MRPLDIAILAVVQGITEPLPVSSSAHVILAEKLLGLDPTAPDMTLMLVMLHLGTMFAVIAYFWRSWRDTYFSSRLAFRTNGLQLAISTATTAVVGVALLQALRYLFAGNRPGFEIEQLFGNAKLIAAGLSCNPRRHAFSHTSGQTRPRMAGRAISCFTTAIAAR